MSLSPNCQPPSILLYHQIQLTTPIQCKRLVIRSFFKVSPFQDKLRWCGHPDEDGDPPLDDWRNTDGFYEIAWRPRHRRQFAEINFGVGRNLAGERGGRRTPATAAAKEAVEDAWFINYAINSKSVLYTNLSYPDIIHLFHLIEWIPDLCPFVLFFSLLNNRFPRMMEGTWRCGRGAEQIQEHCQLGGAGCRAVEQHGTVLHAERQNNCCHFLLAKINRHRTAKL